MKRVFLIDDDTDDRDIFRIALCKLSEPVKFIEARDGHEALEMIADPAFEVPDLVFVDLNMPRVNGYEFVIRMRQMQKYASVPTYIYTTCASPRERVNCMAAGATGYIMKLINPSDLTKELQGLISGLRLSA